MSNPPMDAKSLGGLPELLTQRRPTLPTKAALIILDVQNDFTSPAGKMPITLPVGFIDALRALIPNFRSQGNYIVWARTEYHGPRAVNTPDGEGDAIIATEQAHEEPGIDEEDSEEELLRAALTRPSPETSRYRSAARTRDILQRITEKRAEELRSVVNAKGVVSEQYLSGAAGDKQCCLPNTYGAASPLQAQLMDCDNDMQFVKSHYSAFNSTDLLTALRSRIITKLYLCGCMTNISIYATAVDAARHGFDVSLIRDCLAYRSAFSHGDALRLMSTNMGATVTTAASVIAASCENTPLSQDRSNLDEENAIALRMALGSLSIDKRQPTTGITTRDVSSRVRSHYNKADSAHKRTKLPTPSKAGRLPIPNGTRAQDSTSIKPAAAKPVPPTKIPSPLSADSPRASDISRSGASSTTPTSTPKPSKTFASLAPVLGPGDRIGEGDSRIICDVDFPTAQDSTNAHPSDPGSPANIFVRVKSEVKWQKMYHVSGEVPRLVSVQGKVDADGSMPVYRHPADQSLPLLRFSPQVDLIKTVVERFVGHPMNHVLIQLYRHGEDYISEHSDKTLDIVRGSNIVNVSFGAQRTMRLRTKKSRESSSDEVDTSRQTQKIPMPHGSVFVLGPDTNMRWLHGIQPDKRATLERSANELAYNGERISLTFRHIGTFLNSDSTEIWGQGAISKVRKTANKVINGNATETEKLVRAFGIENQSIHFDWEATYGAGFDVLHFTHQSQPSQPLLYLSADYACNLSCKICLEELQVPFQLFGVAPTESGKAYHQTISFHDTDMQKTQVDGTIPILFYLGRFFSVDESRSITAQTLPLLLEYASWRQNVADSLDFTHFLSRFEVLLEKAEFLSGSKFGIIDCAYWPLVDEALEAMDDTHGEGATTFRAVREWYDRLTDRPSIRKAVWSDAEGEPQESPSIQD